MTDNSNAPRRSGQGDGAQHRATMNRRRNGNSVVPSARGGYARATRDRYALSKAGRSAPSRASRNGVSHEPFTKSAPGLSHVSARVQTDAHTPTALTQRT